MVDAAKAGRVYSRRLALQNLAGVGKNCRATEHSSEMRGDASEIVHLSPKVAKPFQAQMEGNIHGRVGPQVH